MECSRSVYVSRLRRAFLLRVHPDRFTCQKQRVQQAKLVQALSNRLNDVDFVRWQQNQATMGAEAVVVVHGGSFSYNLERRNGKIYKASISLSNSVDQILHDMATAVEQSGAAAPPRPVETTNNNNNMVEPIQKTMQQSLSDLCTTKNNNGASSATSSHVSKGRDLRAFLETMDASEIQTRRTARLDAQALAATIRTVYGFAAVDATSTGWSSESVAVLFRRLLDLHYEYPLRVPSFYPMRLVFSPVVPVVATTDNLDIFGGVLVLHPAATSIQWLESLQMITDSTIADVKRHHDRLFERKKLIKSSLGVNLRKGFTCSSRNYYEFLERLCRIPRPPAEATCTLPAATPLQAVVEADINCRRPKVTKQGSIELGVGMDPLICISAIDRLRNSAQNVTENERNEKHLSRQTEQYAIFCLGLNKARRQTERVSHLDFRDCLSRISQKESQWKQFLTGNSLTVAPTDHFCHLADDGSIVVPHNWQ